MAPALLLLFSWFSGHALDHDPVDVAPRPNIIFIMADDLGWAELGCYGQTKIQTPNIDQLAAEGMKFMQHYAGAPVCAPSRCVLLTGKHPGHAYVRDNTEGGGWGEFDAEGQRPLLPGVKTIGSYLQDQGYATAAIGKWGLGGPESTGDPDLHGFDHFYGYLCQRIAHNFYPKHLWKDGKKEPLEGNVWKNVTGETYSHDLLTLDALQWIRDHRRQPFFLYLPYTIPHLALQVPEDSMEPYYGKWEEIPYDGKRGYLPHPTPRAAYAGMVSRMDRDVGSIMKLLKELKLDENTIVFFTSDNGATYNIGGADSPFFESGGPLRGAKGSVFEGGLRVPLVARWPGRIKAGSSSEHLSAFWDILPTLVEIGQGEVPADTDGISLLPTLLGQEQPQHEYLYWEFPGYKGQQAVRYGKWKGVRRNLNKANLNIMLYDLSTDIAEAHDVAEDHPEVVAHIEAIMAEAHIASPEYPLQTIDG
jgi:arylsulfatase A-like enzyme